jgi:hypothetical protein
MGTSCGEERNKRTFLLVRFVDAAVVRLEQLVENCVLCVA